MITVFNIIIGMLPTQLCSGEVTLFLQITGRCEPHYTDNVVVFISCNEQKHQSSVKHKPLFNNNKKLVNMTMQFTANHIT